MTIRKLIEGSAFAAVIILFLVMVVVPAAFAAEPREELGPPMCAFWNLDPNRPPLPVDRNRPYSSHAPNTGITT